MGEDDFLEFWLQKLVSPQCAGIRKRILERLGGVDAQGGQQKTKNSAAPAPQEEKPKPGAGSGPKPAAWADLFRKPGGQQAPAQKRVPKLWAQAWRAKVTGVLGAAKSEPHVPLVIEVSSEDGWQEAEIRATNREAGTTLVWVGAEGAAEDVLVETAKGPVMAKAKLLKIGSSAPEMVQWKPDKELDDTKASEEVGLVTMRLTVIKEFASPEIFARAKQKAAVLPAVLLPTAACAAVLRTKAIAVYDTGVTCLLTVRADQKEAVSKAETEPGVVLCEHKNKADRSKDSQPRWLVRPKDSAPAEYWTLALEAVRSAGGVIAYRPGGGSCLGAFGNVAKESALPPKWFVTGSPKHWARNDVVSWAETRGFTHACGVRQEGPAAWSLRGWPPAKAEHSKVLSFASGIILAPAKAGKTKAKKVVASAKPSFGAPSEGSKQEDSSKQQPQPTNAESGPVATPARPGSELFDVVECGGDGDCAYTSIATGLADMSKEKGKAKDLQPGGPIQAQLRCWAAKEIRQHPERYEAAMPTPEAYALEVAKNGVWADSVSLMALARAANVEIRIWALRDKLPWQLYELRGSKKPSGIIWFVSEDFHYRLLRSKSEKALPQSLCKGAIILEDGPIKKEEKWQRFAPNETPPAAPEAKGAKRTTDKAAKEADEPGQKQARKDPLTGAGVSGPAAPQGSVKRVRFLEGGGGSRAGSEAASAVPSSSRIRRMLGLGPAAPSECSLGEAAPTERSTRVRKLLGLEAAPSEADYVRGEIYKCRCGWVPSPEKGATAQQAEAKRHWRDCQGEGPPKGHRGAAGSCENRRGGGRLP